MPDARSAEGAAARESAARAALAEITAASDVGELLEEVVEGDGVSTLSFATTRSGYPGWRWTVALAELPGEGPSVLEAELLPGEGALLAPDWVPWADRLEEYRAAQAAAGELDAESAEEGDEDDEDDVDVLDRPSVDLRDLVDFEPDSEDDPEGDGLEVDESATSQDGVEQQDEPETEPGDADPDPVAPPARRQRRKRGQKTEGGE